MGFEEGCCSTQTQGYYCTGGHCSWGSLIFSPGHNSGVLLSLKMLADEGVAEAIKSYIFSWIWRHHLKHLWRWAINTFVWFVHCKQIKVCKFSQKTSFATTVYSVMTVLGQISSLSINVLSQ